MYIWKPCFGPDSPPHKSNKLSNKNSNTKRKENDLNILSGSPSDSQSHIGYSCCPEVAYVPGFRWSEMDRIWMPPSCDLASTVPDSTVQSAKGGK